MPVCASLPDHDRTVRSIGLPTQESRNVELVLFGPVMHRGLSSVLVQTLRRRPLGVFGHRLLPQLRPWRRSPRKPFGARLRSTRRSPYRLGQRRLLLVAAKADSRQPLQQRHPPLLGVLFRRQFSAQGANLVLGRDRKLIDPRHAHRARRRPFWRWRDKCLRLFRLRCARGRVDKQ